MQANWNKSIYYFRQSGKYYVLLGDTTRLATQEYLIGLSLNYAGRYSEAEPILQRLYAKSIATGNRRREVEVGSGLADALRGIGKLDSAEQLFLELIEKEKTMEVFNYIGWSRLYAGLARVLLMKKDWKGAEQYALKAMSLSRKYSYFFPQLEAQQTLFKAYSEMGDYKNAFRHLEMYMKDHDSLQNQETTVQLGIARAVFEHDKAQNTLMANESRKRQIMWFVLSLFASLAIVVGFFYRTLSKQKKTSEKLLANILPKETIHELKQSGVVTPRVHHNVSIMFCDVKDFTAIAEALSPRDLVNMLDDHIRVLDEIVSTHGLEKIKTIGDAYMVAGGLHDQSINYAERIAQAAIEILRTVSNASADMLRKYGHTFSYRIGIHTGSVVSGMVGRDKYAFDVWGDTVNIASRMESTGESGRIHVSEAFAKGSPEGSPKGSHYVFIPRGEIEIKGKGTMKTFWLE